MPVAALGVFFSGPGQTYSISVFIDSYINEFGWSRSYVSTIYSLGTLLAGLMMPMTGRLLDKLGHRSMSAMVAATFGLACLGMSFVANPVMLFIGFWLVRMLGQGSMSLVSATLVPQWFVSKRGRALSLMAFGGAASAAVLPPLNTWLISNYGWRYGWQVWAILLWVVMVPVALLLMRNRPEDVGLVVDGRQDSESPGLRGNRPAEDAAWTVQEAMQTRTFWLLIFCAIIPSAINTGMVFHQVSIMRGAGLTPETAALVLSVMAVVNISLNYVAGLVADKVRINRMIAWTFVGRLVVILVLLRVNSVGMALVYGVLSGVFGASESIYSGVVWPNYFGRRYLGSIRGVAMTAMVAGSAFGPILYGAAFDFVGGYQQILVISMLFPLLGVIAALLAVAPKKQTSSPTFRSKPSVAQ